MNVKRRPLGFAIASLLALVPAPLASAQAPSQAPNPQAQAPSQEASYRVRYAQMYITLAKLNLQAALNTNQQAPNTIPKGQIDVLKSWVALAEQWAQATNDAAAGKLHNVALAEAKIVEKAAQEQYDSAVKLNQIAPMNPVAFEKLRVKLEMAHLRVAAAKQLDPNNPQQILQFQFERLQEDVAELAALRLRAFDLD